MRSVLIELTDPTSLKSLLDRGESDRELCPPLPSDLRDGEWLTLTVRVGQSTTRLPARVRDLGDGKSLSLSERDWVKLSCFSSCCRLEAEASRPTREGRLDHPPSGVTAIVRGRVFVLCEEDCLAKVISATLTAAGFDAIVSSSAEDLVSGVIERPTNVVILDGQVPDTSVNLLCQRLQALAPSQRPAVLILVASSSPSDGASALTWGADDYLLTPFRRQELLVRVGSLLHRAQSNAELSGAA